jgi:fatty acid desaturase
MEENAKLIESLYEKVVDYGVTSFELIKLKALDKASDVASSFFPNAIVFVVIASFLLLLNLGLAFWLGEMLGKVFLGFFIVAGFYGLVAFVLHFFMHKWLKKHFQNYIIKLMFK